MNLDEQVAKRSNQFETESFVQPASIAEDLDVAAQKTTHVDHNETDDATRVADGVDLGHTPTTSHTIRIQIAP